MHGLNQYDFDARQQDPTLAGRFTSIDPLAEKYYSWSPYVYCLNNPLKYIDPDGRDAYLLIWSTNGRRSGHAALAFDNYDKVPVLDKKGNAVLGKDGKPTHEMVANGTYTYMDLWPTNESLNLLDANTFVDANYQTKGLNYEELVDRDASGKEDSPADGVIKITASYEQGEKAKEALSIPVGKSMKFNPSKWNCANFAEYGINSLGIGNIDATEQIVDGVKAKTPNALYKSTVRLKSSSVVRDPGNAVNTPFFRIGGATTKKAAKNK